MLTKASVSAPLPAVAVLPERDPEHGCDRGEQDGQHDQGGHEAGSGAHRLLTGPTSSHVHASSPRIDRSGVSRNRTGPPSASTAPESTPVSGS